MKYKPYKDLSGKKFGRLTVMGLHSRETRPGHTIYKWDCKCSCGGSKVAMGSNLTNGNTKSCGCLLRENNQCKRKDTDEVSFNNVFHGYKGRAKMRGLKFSLTQDFVRVITQLPCAYCGEPPKNLAYGRRGRRNYIYNGIDRINNTEGYEEWNCAPCCSICNYAKGTLSKLEFDAHIDKMYKKLHEG